MKTYLNGGREVEGVERERERERESCVEVSVEEECKLRNRKCINEWRNHKEQAEMGSLELMLQLQKCSKNSFIHCFRGGGRVGVLKCSVRANRPQEKTQLLLRLIC